MNGINQGTLPFDELALFIACRCFNIHAIVMLDNDVWSTETNVLHSKATVRLAYCGKNSYREIADINDELVMELAGSIADSVDIDLTDSDSGYEEQTGDENIEKEDPLDLHVSDDDVIFLGTSQLGPEELSTIVVKPEPVEQDDDDVVYVDTVYLTEDEMKAKQSSVQVKKDPDGPVDDLNAAPDGSSVSNEAVASSKNYNPDVSSAVSNPQDSSVAVASTSKYNRTYLECDYKCHLCDLQTCKLSILNTCQIHIQVNKYHADTVGNCFKPQTVYLNTKGHICISIISVNSALTRHNSCINCNNINIHTHTRTCGFVLTVIKCLHARAVGTRMKRVTMLI